MTKQQMAHQIAQLAAQGFRLCFAGWRYNGRYVRMVRRAEHAHNAVEVITLDWRGEA